jgi:prevent-host-death family protein
MAKYSASEARANFNELLTKAQTEAVEIHKHGKPAVVILDAMKYEEFLDYVEDLEDTIAILEHRLNPSDPSDRVSMAELALELGLPIVSDPAKISD